MKKNCLLAFAIAGVLVGCSEDELVSENVSNLTREIPIEFSVQKENVTRGTQNLEAVNHYNFGVWAYKVGGKNTLTTSDALVMDNYLVGYSDGSSVGYDTFNATTFDATANNDKDHKGPWFYEGLGTDEYKYVGNAGFYTTSSTNYLSNNKNQYLRYWDLAYATTNFYAYAPYVHNEGTDKVVTFNHEQNGTSTMTFAANTIRDGYDNTVNTAYEKYDRSLSEFMYAGVKATNAELKDVEVPFKHMGAQVGIRFYEDIPGYKVEIINLGDDEGTFSSSLTNEDMKKGIQLTPSVAPATGTDYTLGEYYTTSGATVEFDDTNVSSEGATFTPIYDKSTKVSTPLMFAVPTDGLTGFGGTNNDKYQVIKEIPTTGTQEYSNSPTIYYAVAQPEENATEFTKSGFTIHVSYRIIAEDNEEVITVHNATVHIPYKDSSDQLITIWQPNTKYTYTFKITKNSTGTTNPGTEIDPTEPTPSDVKALYPIVFDQATIEDYTPVENETTHNDGDTDY